MFHTSNIKLRCTINGSNPNLNYIITLKRETCKMYEKYLNKSLKTIEPSCPWTSKVSRVGWNEGIYVASSKFPKPITLLYSFIYRKWTTSASSIPLHIFREMAISCYFRSSSHFWTALYL